MSHKSVFWGSYSVTILQRFSLFSPFDNYDVHIPYFSSFLPFCGLCLPCIKIILNKNTSMLLRSSCRENMYTERYDYIAIGLIIFHNSISYTVVCIHTYSCIIGYNKCNSIWLLICNTSVNLKEKVIFAV
jgi:hypothetical protein